MVVSCRPIVVTLLNVRNTENNNTQPHLSTLCCTIVKSIHVLIIRNVQCKASQIFYLNIESYTLLLCLSGQQWCAPLSMSSVTRHLNTWQAQIWPMVDSTGSWISAGTLFPSGRWIDAKGTEHCLSGTQRKCFFLLWS